MERRLVELLIGEEETGLPVEAISLVKHPAIEKGFLFFSKGKKTKALSLAQLDEDKRTLIGPALIPDKHIERFDEESNESYDVYFSKETVKLASELYMKHSRTNEHTLEHEVAIDDVHVVESWIVEDPEMDKSKHYGMSVPQGTWMVRVRVDNDEMWQQVKDGTVRGLSIEGYFVDAVEEMSVKSKPTEMKKVLKKIWFSIKRKFYSEITLNNGVVIATEDDSFGLGTSVIAIDPEGLPTDLKDGSYITEKELNFKVFEGVITEWDGEREEADETQDEAENTEDDEVVEMDKVELDQEKVKFWRTYLDVKMKKKRELGMERGLIAEFEDGRGSHANVFKQPTGVFYIVVSGEFDYDMEAYSISELQEKLERDGFHIQIYGDDLVNLSSQQELLSSPAHLQDFEDSLQAYEIIVEALDDARIPAEIRLDRYGVIDILLGLDYPDRLSDDVSDIVEDIGLGSLLGGSVHIAADSTGGSYVEKERVNGGVQEWEREYGDDDY